MTPEVKERFEQIRHGNVPEGYKKSLKGIIPKHWEVVRLDSVATGFDYGMNAPAVDYDGANRYIRITDIDEESRKYISEKCVSPGDMLDERYLVLPNDILFARTGASTGKTYLYDCSDGRLFFAGFLIRIHVMNNTDARFVFYYTQSDEYKRWLDVMSVRSGQPGINAQEFAAYRIMLPSTAEQIKIANILSAQDKIIELKMKQISEKQLQKKYYCRKLFAQPSIDMKRVCLSDICSINDDTVKENSLHTPFYYIDISCVETGHINKPSTKMLFEDAPVRARRKIQNGDILLSTVRPYLHAFAIVNFSANDYIASTGFSVLRPRNSVATEIIFQQLISEDMDRQFTNLLVGTNYPAINSTDVGRLKVWMPSDSNVIERISKLFSTIDTEIELLQKDLEQEKQKKKALMQLLLTGIVRVSV